MAIQSKEPLSTKAVTYCFCTALDYYLSNVKSSYIGH